jgi:Dolichyl-phosphate-mannose-protein mannosyltransferase
MVYSAYLLLMLLCFRVFSYADLIGWFTSQYPDAYLIDEYSTRYLTFTHFTRVQHAAPFMITTGLLLVIFSLWKKKRLIGILNKLVSDLSWVAKVIGKALSNLSTIEKGLLATCFISLIAIKIYLFINVPYSVDEAFNFVYFVDKGFLHTTLYSNNHILYNLISVLWWKTGMGTILSSRLTSMLTALLIHILLFAMAKHYFNFKTAVFILMVTGITFWFNIYSILGTTYTLLTFFTLLGAVCLFHFFESNDRGYYLFILSCCLGFYCSKLFIIPFLSFILLWVGVIIYRGQQPQRIIDMIKSIFAVLFFSGLLYLPMFLWSGANVLFMSDVATHDFISDLPILFESLSVMTDVNSKSYLPISGLLILCAFLPRMADDRVKIVIALNTATVISLLLFVVVTHVYPPARAVVYSNVLFYFMLGTIVATAIPQLVTTGRQVAVVSFMIISLKAWGSMYMLQHSWQNTSGSMQDKTFYQRLNLLTNCIMAYKPQLIFADRQDGYVNIYLSLAAIRQRKHLNFTYDRSNMLKADVNILQDSSTLPGDRYVRLKEDEFGTIFLNNEQGRAFVNDCLPFE